MAERKSFLKQAAPLSHNSSRIGKRWKQAIAIHNGRDKNINYMVETYYKELLNYAKSLISTMPDAYSRTVFERDYREDESENSFTMHSFLTPNVHLLLECDFAYHYRVEYDFFNCPFEELIIDKMTGMRTLFRYAEQKHLQPNCEEYLKRVFKVQDEKYILVL
jgi:hypothetical protein